MLVPSHYFDSVQHSPNQHRLCSSMAPMAPPPAIDLRSQVIENCKFFSRQDADISLVTAMEPLGKFKALILRAEQGNREVLMSELAPTLQEAIHGLHVKSATAVQNYISTNGYAFAASLKKRGLKPSSDSEDGSDSDTASVSSTVTVDQSPSTYEESLSDNETVSVTSTGVLKKRSRGKLARASKNTHVPPKTKAIRRSRSRSRSPARSRSCSRSSDDDSENDLDPTDSDVPAIPNRRPPFFGGFSQRVRCAPPRGMPWMAAGIDHHRSHPPPPPPPPAPPGGWRMPPPHAFHVIPSPSNNPSVPKPQQPPSTNQTSTSSRPIPTTTTTTNNTSPRSAPSPTNPNPTPQQHLHDVLLRIHWRHHGEQRTLEQTPLTIRALQDTALGYVRRSPGSFTNVTTADKSPARLWHLRASVISLHVDGEDYDLRNYSGDDLSRFVGALAPRGVVRFEVEVTGPVSVPGEYHGHHGNHLPGIRAVMGGGNGVVQPSCVWPPTTGMMPMPMPGGMGMPTMPGAMHMGAMAAPPPPPPPPPPSAGGQGQGQEGGVGNGGRSRAGETGVGES